MLNTIKRALGMLPPKNWAKGKLLEFTPDVLELEAHGFQRIFVADEIQTGHRRNDLVNEWGACIATAFSQEQFTHLCHKLGEESYSFVLKDKVPGIKQTFLKGELHLIRSTQIKYIDNYKKQGEEFIRERIKLVIPYREMLQGTGETSIVSEQKLEFLDAWFYRGNHSYFYPFLDAGYSFKPVTTFAPNYLNKDWLGEFSYFTPQDCK